jgi:hypothetical protein
VSNPLDDGRPLVRLEPSDPVSRRLWREVGRLADEVLVDGWTLIGGLMVQLHGVEAGETDLRVTTDVDIVADARSSDGFERIVTALTEDGFELHDPGPFEVGHRWERDGVVLDLLAPDGLREDPRVSGRVRTVQVPGGTQALARTEVVEIEIEGVTRRLRRPTLLGAILIKARSLLVHDDPDAQRADLILLLSLLDDPRATARQLKGRERQWLVDAEGPLALDDPDLAGSARARRARAAFQLLTR